MPILVDYSQISMAAVFVAQNEYSSDVNQDIMRHMILKSLVAVKKKLSSKFGEMIICCDGSRNWRKDYFPYYKASRSESKAESATDWDKVYEYIHTVRDEIKEFLPFRTLHLEKCEGDDIIAVLAKYFESNELIQVGLDEIPKGVVIVSTDKDFRQLQIMPHVKQFSNIKHEWIRESDPNGQLMELIIKGDRGDGVPNVMSPNDTFVLGNRQTTISQKRYDKILESIVNGTPHESELVNSRLVENRVLVDLINSIPENIKLSVIQEYQSVKVPPKSKLLGYFISHNLSNLSSEIQNF